MITTIMAYKFTNLTREEVEAMLGIELQETSFYKSSLLILVNVYKV